MGRPITEILVKSLMVPPGVPDFVTRDRCLRAGKARIEGRAWSGAGKDISEVEFGINGKWKKQEFLVRLGSMPGQSGFLIGTQPRGNIFYNAEQKMSSVANSL